MQPGRPASTNSAARGGIRSLATPIILRVRAASVNPVDYKIQSGKYPAVTESPSSRPDKSIGESKAAVGGIIVGFAPPPSERPMWREH